MLDFSALECEPLDYLCSLPLTTIDPNDPDLVTTAVALSTHLSICVVGWDWAHCMTFTWSGGECVSLYDVCGRKQAQWRAPWGAQDLTGADARAFIHSHIESLAASGEYPPKDPPP